MMEEAGMMFKTTHKDIHKRLQLISVPFGLGGKREGAELGPEAIVQAGLLRELRRIGIEDVSVRQVDAILKRAVASGSGEAKYLQEVAEMSKRVADYVSWTVSESLFPLVLGGDHSVSIGSLAGLTARYSDLGVIWFDAHPDLNTEVTSPSGNMHGMPLAIGLGKAKWKLADLAGKGSFVNKEKLVIVGARDIDDGEKELIRSEGIACFTMQDIDRMGIEAVVEKALQVAGSGTDGVHLSFDLDSLDPMTAPGVGTPVSGGVNYREAHFAMELMAESKLITSMDIVELNPLLDTNRRTAHLAVGLISSLMGKRIL